MFLELFLDALESKGISEVPISLDSAFPSQLSGASHSKNLLLAETGPCFVLAVSVLEGSFEQLWLPSQKAGAGFTAGLQCWL